MNGAVVGSGGGQWLERGTKIAVFDLPDASTDIEIDLSDVEQTRKRKAVPADATDEIRADDILAEFPVDPTQPFHLRVPDALLARAAQLTAQLPRDRDRDTVPPPPRAALRRAAWVFATVIGASVGIVLAAAIAHYESAPIPSAPAHTFKAGTSAKIIAQRASMLGTGVMVPTVSVDSLPRARR